MTLAPRRDCKLQPWSLVYQRIERQPPEELDASSMELLIDLLAVR